MRTGVIGGTGFFVFALFVVLSEVVGMGLSEFRYICPMQKCLCEVSFPIVLVIHQF